MKLTREVAELASSTAEGFLTRKVIPQNDSLTRAVNEGFDVELAMIPSIES
jgi:hypothetical protein